MRIAFWKRQGNPEAAGRTPESSQAKPALLEQAFLGSGVMPPVPAIESDSPVTNIRPAARGLGLAIVPGVVMREALSAGAVEHLHAVPPLPRTSVGMACRVSALAHRRIRALREALNALREPGTTSLLLR